MALKLTVVPKRLKELKKAILLEEAITLSNSNNSKKVYNPKVKLTAPVKKKR